MHLQLKLKLTIAGLLLFAVTGMKMASAAELPDYAREYIAGSFFNGTDPGDPAISECTEILEIPPAMLENISTLDWEAGQLKRFADNKLFLLVDCPDGTTHSLMFRDGKKRSDRTLDAGRVRVLRRLYNAELWSLPPDPALQKWLERDDVDNELVWNASLRLCDSKPLDAADLTRAEQNYNSEASSTDELAIALGALADSGYPAETARAAIWLISRMDKMEFRHENGTDNIPDLSAIDAQTFYENVYYAAKARMEFPWAAEVSEEDFLQQVLSPRGSGEPLQRWRRHFYLALLPEVEDFGPEDTDRATSIARNAYADYYQYEGDTTWEDFGMLSSLAVHEGRCEDCSNVENAFLRSIGIPGCQAYTPWWGHQDGNHAWTWLRGIGDPPGDGNNGVKVFVKTWDGNEDVTAAYTPVIEIRVPTAAADESEVQLMVWNSDDWRKLTTEKPAGAEVVFSDVGCRLNQALCFRSEGQPDQLCDLRSDGSYSWLRLDPAADDPAAGFPVNYDKSTPLGEMDPGEDYELLVYTAQGWITAPSARLSTGGFTFEGYADRLYRISGAGVANRPFTVELDETGEVATQKR
jgi:hypothetical protein